MGNQYSTEWTDERISEGIMRIASTFEPERMPSNREVVEHEGNYALANAIQKNGGYSYWANKLGLERKHSETKLGITGESHIAHLLRQRGHEVDTTSVKFPYDLLIDRCIKVDVKTANESDVRGYPIHSYRLAKRKQTCDFYIFYEADTGRVYVVPANKLNGQVQVGMGLDSKEYAKYLGAYHLIDEAVDMYQRM